jgi:L-threonylcarbamoyladenylate synthase
MKKVSLAEAVKILKNGGLVIYPTETAYGLGADATDRPAAAAVYRQKSRSARKPLATIAASEAMVRRFFALEPAAARLARRYWPGPLTLILRVRDRRLARALGRDRLGVRVSGHPLARALSRGLGAPIVATSANRSGRGNRYSPRTAAAEFGDLPVLDAGTLPRRRPSTVVAFKRGRPVVLRQGMIGIISSE